MYPPTVIKSSCDVTNSFLRKYTRKDEEAGANWGNLVWYDPPQNSAPVKFFLDTSLHGLQYLGQRRRHLCERIFWLTAFLAAMITSFILIWEMWESYLSMPIVTVFNPTEKTLDQIPFPAVTICNVNNIKKSIWEKYKTEANLGLQRQLPEDMRLKRLANVYDIFHICHSAKPFTEKVNSQSLRRSDPFKEEIDVYFSEYSHLLDPVETLRNASQSCEEMILFCLWLGKATNCSELFQEIETDFGICCTFNLIPVSLLKRSYNNSKEDPELVKGWRDSNLNYDNMLLEKQYEGRPFPLRQLYPGRSAGLSFLVDPELHEYHCTNTDSEGFVVALNLPLDFPRMKDNGNAVRTSSEVFISVRPEVTMSAKSAKNFNLKTRGCYFDGEKKLKHYTKYTASNCMDECIARKTLDTCYCLRYYMPGNGTEALCEAHQYNCTEEIRDQIIRGGLNEECSDCLPSCSEILYHSEATSLKVNAKHVSNLFDANPHLNKVEDASIIHVYFNVDSVFPRLLKEKSTIIELISNAGGLLGLCMGFSLLSLLEIVYHLTVRLCVDKYHNCSEEANEEDKANDEIRKAVKGISDERRGRQKNVGFLSKVLLRNNNAMTKNFVYPLPYNNGRKDEIFYKSERNPLSEDNSLPPYLWTPFESDFQRLHYATAWSSEQI